ncbi:MAG TPA: NADP-dependent oxidoreductase [Solirubrobacteraceae bacterium]|nr:NADP-dependent oxidoreductase [Solirubrobacteraceae bacterium]
MKAVRFAEYGGPGVLRVDEVPEPHPAAGQVRVSVRAAGVNPVDWKIRSGAMAGVVPVDFPRTIGSDVAGVVDELGDGVSDVSVGDEIFGSAVGGASAEYAVLDHYAAKPASLSWAEASGYPVVVETALRVLKLLCATDGQTLIVNGAAGGVGIAAVQFARERGARVIGTASESNHDFLRELGAEPTTYGDGLVARVLELSPGGADRAFDAAGHGALPALIELTGSPDNVVTIADFTAPEHGVRVTTGRDGRSWEALGQAAELHDRDRFTLPVERTFRFSEAADAHRLSEEGHVRGKLVLVPDGLADA